MMFKEIGIMQGRLLPKYKNRYQAHPKNAWKSEFEIARQMGLSYIEFILDFDDYEQNPLMSERGIQEISEIVQKSGIGVKSICADYFMNSPIHSDNQSDVEISLSVLKKLILNASFLGISDIVLPCVDHSSLKNEKSINKFIVNILPILDYLSKHEINLALETDLPPQEFSFLLNKLNSNNITVNYDTGNSASLGYKVEDEFSSYGHKISDIHIKDRTLKGGSVILGSGNVDFNSFFKEARKINFNGLIVMQAFRDEEGVVVFRKQYDWFKEKLREFKKNNDES